MAEVDTPLLHICYAPADRGWVLGRMVHELGLSPGQFRTREDDGLGELQLQAIADAVEQCRFTVLVASSAARWDKLAQFAAGMAQHAALEDGTPRLVIVARDFAPAGDAGSARLPLAQRALVRLDCADEARTVAALARLRALLALGEPVDEHPGCPYPGLARFTAANRDLLFGRDRDRDRQARAVEMHHAGVGSTRPARARACRWVPPSRPAVARTDSPSHAVHVSSSRMSRHTITSVTCGSMHWRSPLHFGQARCAAGTAIGWSTRRRCAGGVGDRGCRSAVACAAC